MTDHIELPPLPVPAIKSSQTDSVMRVTTVHSFSHDQVDEYGQACYEAGLRARQTPAPAEVSMLADGLRDFLDWFIQSNSTTQFTSPRLQQAVMLRLALAAKNGWRLGEGRG